jgi:two-component system response regulator LytT
MIRAIIVEDEDLSAKRLRRLLKGVKADIKVIKQLETVVDTIDFLRENKDEIDLIFLDIHLADGYSFEIFKQIEVNIPIVFTTAYDQYALQAFQEMSVDYLMKPVQEEELERSLKKFNRLFYKKKDPFLVDYAALLKALKSPQSALKKRFLIQVGSKIRSIDVENIHLFYAHNKACFLITNQGKRYDINYTLDKLISQLDSEQFFKLNRKIIVHIQSIEEVVQFSRSRYKVTLRYSPGFDVFISAERMSAFKQWLNF